MKLTKAQKRELEHLADQYVKHTADLIHILQRGGHGTGTPKGSTKHRFSERLRKVLERLKQIDLVSTEDHDEYVITSAGFEAIDRVMPLLENLPPLPKFKWRDLVQSRSGRLYRVASHEYKWQQWHYTIEAFGYRYIVVEDELFTPEEYL